LLLTSAVAIVISFISYLVPISRTIALVLLVVAILLAGLGSGLLQVSVERLFHLCGRVISALIGYGNRSNVSQTCTEVADALERLLREVADGYWKEMGAVAKYRANRQVIRRYKLEHRQNVCNAIAQAGAIVSVPPEIKRYAEQPRNVNDLLWLRDWLRRIGEECELG
jgi:hypothetical protein